jgi:hypothetical protein
MRDLMRLLRQRLVVMLTYRVGIELKVELTAEVEAG